MSRNGILVVKYLALLLPLASSDDKFELPLDATARPVPPELQYVYNVTKSNFAYCVYQYGQCLSLHTKVPLCAINREGKTRYFINHCQMIQENCRWDRVIWNYFNDEDEEKCMKRNGEVPTSVPT